MPESEFARYASRAEGTDPPAIAELQELLTVEDVAVLLKVSKSWVYEHTRVGGTPRHDRLPHIRIGKYVRFDGGAVRAFLARKSHTP